jgi:hypothetical protein
MKEILVKFGVGALAVLILLAISLGIAYGIYCLVSAPWWETLAKILVTALIILGFIITSFALGDHLVGDV